jgi:hypothetical protein
MDMSESSSSRGRSFVRSVPAALAFALSAAACAPSGPDSVWARAEVVDRTTQRLSVGALTSINGTYGGACMERSGGWSVRVSGVDPLTNPALSVVTNDTACVLTVTSLVADQTYTASPSFDLTASYQGTASEFQAAATTAFYGNLKLSAVSFASNFVVSVLYSDDVRAASNTIVAGHSSVSATSSATSVTAPNYTIDFVSDAFTVLTDAGDVVTSVSGKVDLTDGSTTGSAYVVDVGTLAASPTFAEIDAAYAAGTPVAIGGANPQINASAFSLVGVDLTTSAVRTILIKRVVSGVSAYQTFKVTFAAVP